MKYAYLDHNIVDKIDSDFKGELVDFLHEINCIPIVSTSSLVEIERGGSSDRVQANISSLLSIGTKFLLETDSRVIVATLNEDKVFELLSSSNQRVVEALSFLDEIRFQINQCTSRNELINKIDKALPILNKFEKENNLHSTNFQKYINSLEILKTEYVPNVFHYSTDLRGTLSFNPRETNNLKPSELWNKIKSVEYLKEDFLVNDRSEMAIRHQIFMILTILKDIGYWADYIDSKQKQQAFTFDCFHAIYGSYCYAIISSDKRFLRRLNAAYYYLSIDTKIFQKSKSGFSQIVDQ